MSSLSQSIFTPWFSKVDTRSCMPSRILFQFIASEIESLKRDTKSNIRDISVFDHKKFLDGPFISCAHVAWQTELKTENEFHKAAAH